MTKRPNRTANLYRLVRANRADGKGTTYLLLPMTSRRMPAHVALGLGDGTLGMEDLVSRIAGLPKGSRLYIARMDEFDDPEQQLSRVSEADIQRLRSLLAHEGIQVVLVE